MMLNSNLSIYDIVQLSMVITLLVYLVELCSFRVFCRRSATIAPSEPTFIRAQEGHMAAMKSTVAWNRLLLFLNAALIAVCWLFGNATQQVEAIAALRQLGYLLLAAAIISHSVCALWIDVAAQASHCGAVSQIARKLPKTMMFAFIIVLLVYGYLTY